MTRAQIEKRWGVTIRDDSFWNPISAKEIKCYRVYSADGCPWENGLRTLKAVERECRIWSDRLLYIKKCTERYKDI